MFVTVGKKILKKFNATELQQYPVTAQWMVELQSPWKGQQAIGRLWFIQYSEGMAYSPFFLSKITFSQAEFFAGLVPQQIAPYKLIQDFYLQLKQFSPRKPWIEFTVRTQNKIYIHLLSKNNSCNSFSSFIQNHCIVLCVFA